jgi:hypothetical protein
MDGNQPQSTIRDDQFAFARHNFDNLQSLIRAADAKAGLYVTILFFLAASTIPLGKDVILKLRWVWCGGGFSGFVYLLSYFALATGFVWSLALIRGVVTPRPASHYLSPQAGHELHYYRHVLMHKDNSEYFDAVRSAAPELLLRNVTDQIFELAYICHEKMKAVHEARLPITIAFCAWVANIGLGLWIARWK